VVPGFYLVREVVQVAGELLHLLDDAIQRPVKRSEGRTTPVVHVTAMERRMCGGLKARQPCPEPLWVTAEQ